ncbi:hypothetical protein BsWGS_06631 [Bradybaena similaris]
MLALLILISFLEYADGFRIVCYYTNTAQYRAGGGQFLPDDIVPQLCTHIVYAFAMPTGLGIGATDENDIPTQNDTGMYERVLEIKELHPDIKILLALAGPNTNTHPYTPILATPVSRSAFAHNVIAFLRKYGFDGLEVSWRYPDVHGKPVLNREKFVLLFKELKETFTVDGFMRNAPSLLLTAVLPGAKDIIESNYDMIGILEYADYISLMTFDHRMSNNTLMLRTKVHDEHVEHAYFDEHDDHNERVDPDEQFSLEALIHYMKELDVARDKLNIGITLSAATYSIDATADLNVGSPSSGLGEPGPLTQTQGMLAYYEVCTLIKKNATIINYDAQDVRILFNDKMWVSYEDVLSVITKVCFARDNEVGGVMVRSLDLDDFTGRFCGQGRYPLMTGIASVIRDSSCRNYVGATHMHNGQRPLMKSSRGRIFINVGLSLVILFFKCHAY